MFSCLKSIDETDHLVWNVFLIEEGLLVICTIDEKKK